LNIEKSSSFSVSHIKIPDVNIEDLKKNNKILLTSFSSNSFHGFIGIKDISKYFFKYWILENFFPKDIVKLIISINDF
jgi:hypothetical protein